MTKTIMAPHYIKEHRFDKKKRELALDVQKRRDANNHPHPACPKKKVFSVREGRGHFALIYFKFPLISLALVTGRSNPDRVNYRVG